MLVDSFRLNCQQSKRSSTSQCATYSRNRQLCRSFTNACYCHIFGTRRKGMRHCSVQREWAACQWQDEMHCVRAKRYCPWIIYGYREESQMQMVFNACGESDCDSGPGRIGGGRFGRLSKNKSGCAPHQVQLTVVHNVRPASRVLQWLLENSVRD